MNQSDHGMNSSIYYLVQKNHLPQVLASLRLKNIRLSNTDCIVPMRKTNVASRRRPLDDLHISFLHLKRSNGWP